MGGGERLLNVAASLSLFSWAVLGLSRAAHDGRVCIVRICITVLHIVVGVAFATRLPLRRAAPTRDLVKAGVSFVVGGAVFKLAPDPFTWPVASTLLFMLGTMLATASLVVLGRSFAILPALREVVVRGPYRWVRHPAYLGELGLIGACATSAPDPRLLALAGVGVVAVVIRIQTEERLLMTTEAYQQYAERVPSRLVPGLW